MAAMIAAFMNGERGSGRHGEEVVVCLDSEGPVSSRNSDFFSAFSGFFFKSLEYEAMERSCIRRHVRLRNVLEAGIGVVILHVPDMHVV